MRCCGLSLHKLELEQKVDEPRYESRPDDGGRRRRRLPLLLHCLKMRCDRICYNPVSKGQENIVQKSSTYICMCACVFVCIVSAAAVLLIVLLRRKLRSYAKCNSQQSSKQAERAVQPINPHDQLR